MIGLQTAHANDSGEDVYFQGGPAIYSKDIPHKLDEKRDSCKVNRADLNFRKSPTWKIANEMPQELDTYLHTTIFITSAGVEFTCTSPSSSPVTLERMKALVGPGGLKISSASDPLIINHKLIRETTELLTNRRPAEKKAQESARQSKIVDFVLPDATAAPTTTSPAP
jgi:hypothetical protein